MTDSPPTGSELVYLQTDSLSLTIKGPASHPSFQGVEVQEGESSLTIYCEKDFQLTVRGIECPGVKVFNRTWAGEYAVAPLFFEQQRYELVLEGEDGHELTFWHDNLNVRNKITRTGRRHEILSGILNFGNEIGYSDLVVLKDGRNYLKLRIEVYPSKISYREDYKAIVEDVTREVYSLSFDFLKKTYLNFEQGDHRHTSPVEFFSVLRGIFNDYLRAADVVLTQPHHVLQTVREILPAHKIRRTDGRTLRYLENHPDQVQIENGQIRVAKALAVRKQVTFNTPENRMVRYILQSTLKRLRNFQFGYSHLQREEDVQVVRQLDEMIAQLERRSNTGFLRETPAAEAPQGMSLVFSMAAGYRELYRYYLMLLRGLSITGDIFQISMKDLAVLYEYWCFLKLNSLMRDKYQLVSQDVIRVQMNGIYVALVKGKGSRVRYRDPVTGDQITLSYNPKAIDVPTVSQRPDNVLTLEKKGANTNYQYVFDAKYRINPALPGTDYYNSISHTPGPEVDDINTMHRYRDAIVRRNGDTPYERSMFGAYVLFPYSNEEEYRNHRFYKSVEDVNIGGLPFLPSALGMVSDMLSQLIADSPESAFERATLPAGIEEKLAKVDWNVRDVLIGSVRSKEDLEVFLEQRFYSLPGRILGKVEKPIHWVALYQPRSGHFGSEAGIRWYGEVVRWHTSDKSSFLEKEKQMRTGIGLRSSSGSNCLVQLPLAK